jgi:hypothetical protein
LQKSIKLGYRNRRKTGEAMIAFDTKDRALHSLNEDRMSIMGRYLEVRLASNWEYEKFK